jgi:thymidylate kinase
MDEKPLVLNLVARLCDALKASKVNYCHWKSNNNLHLSANGENDLDLLVSREDSQKFFEILWKLGFKQTYPAKEDKLPGVVDYYGYDTESDRIVHAHVHFQLVLGHDLSKNYRLPIERSFLESAVQGELFRVPIPEFEFVVFIIRMILKHSTLSSILMLHGGLASSERRELEFLQSRSSMVEVDAVIEQHLPYISHNLLEACLMALQPGASLLKRIRTGQQLLDGLKACARRSQMADTFLQFSRRVILPIQSRLHLRMPKNRMANGGLLIAIIGGDGSGKTTAINGIYAKLSDEFDIVKIHMGKPAWSLTTVVIRGLLKIGRSLGFFPFAMEGSESTIDTYSPKFPGYPWLIREVCTARDRYLTYKSIRRFATNGGLVLCDRFPLAEVKIMDGPQVERLTQGVRSNRFLKFLARLEKHYYDQIMSPDLLIALRVDPEISVVRKTDETAESVRTRAGEIWNIDWRKTPAHVIDASKSKSEVLVDLISLIWSHL